MSGRFYIYRIFQDAETVYVGKGSGRRLKNQMRRFGCDGEIIQWCRTERLAYAAEKRWIDKLKPAKNCNAGGGGSFAARRINRRDKATIEIERIGTRVYAARMLLKFDLRGHVTPEQMTRLREVANLSKAC